MVQQGENNGGRIVDFFRAFLPFLWKNFNHDRILLGAASLAYQTLLSLVPLLAVILSILNLFEVFSPLRPVMEGFLIRNFMPETGLLLREYFSQFIERATTMSLVGGLFLLIAALVLISTIDHTINHIWGVFAPRKLLEGFTLYWTVLTLGPVLIGTSLAASSYAWYTLVTGTPFPLVKTWMLGLFPVLNSLVAFTLLYLLVPNRKVRFAHALAGGVFTTMVFELFKKGFGFYISNIASYETIYGALSVVPILFFWIYLSWAVVLSGAEIVHSLGAISTDPEASTPFDPLWALPPLIAMLEAIRKGAREGKPMTMKLIIRAFDRTDPMVLRKILDILLLNRFVHLTAGGELEVSSELYSLTLYDLYAAIPPGFRVDEDTMSAAFPISGRLDAARGEVDGCLRDSLQVPVVSLMEQQ